MRPRSQGRARLRPSARVERRRSADRARILRAAAERFAERGPERVTLDDIADAADVARGTFYSHFSSKEALTLELMRPVLEEAMEGVERAARSKRAVDRVSALLMLYLGLWERHADALRLSHRMMLARDPTSAARLHMAFVGRVVDLFEGAARAGILRAPTPELAARTLAQVAVPLLELYAPSPGGRELFLNAMRGLLLEEPAPRVSRRRSTGPAGGW